MSKKIILVGGTVLKAHLDNNCFKHMRTVKTYFGMSPFSLGEQPSVQNVPKKRLMHPVNYDANNDFDSFLKKNSADFIFIDLQKILVDLLEVDGHFYTNQPKNGDEFYTANQDKIITVTENKYERFYQVFDSFAQIIRQYFEPQNIILLSSYVPAFYSSGRQVRLHKNKFGHNDWYQHFEKRFVNKTGCIYYDKCRHYFNEKHPGNPIKFAVFESEYYTEADSDFQCIINNKNYPTQPNYKLCVQRYARYYPTLNKEFLSLFLSVDDPVDRFLMCCPDDYAAKNCEKYVSLKQDEDSLNTLLSEIHINEFIKTYRAFLFASENPDSEIPNIDLLFKNGIMIPQLLKAVRSKSDIPFKKQITYNNYCDFYYKKDAQELPRVVDIIGSCVSRFIFNFNEKDFAVNNYAFHYMPIMTDITTAYDDKFFNNNIWTHKMMKLQADCGLRDFLIKNKAEWAVVDLFPLIELTAFMLNGKPIGSSDHFAKKRNFEEILICDRYTQEEILAELKNFADLLKSLYCDKIILIASRRQILKVDDTDKIVPYTKAEVNILRNEKCRIFEKAFCEYTNCRYIDIVRQFCSDDLSFVSVSPIHYEDSCYIEEGKIIKKIIDENPEQRVFSDYDSDTRLKRIIRFKKSGNNIDILKQIFDKWQDEILLGLSPKQIEHNFSFLKSIYSIDAPTPQLKDELKRNGISLSKFL